MKWIPVKNIGQYFLAVSCGFLLPTAYAIRSTDQPRLPGGCCILGYRIQYVIYKKIALYPFPKVKWFYG
jgi:hypothetical protein